MARKQATYATAPYGLADIEFCKYIAELEACHGIRSDVRRNCVVLSVCALTRTWPASHYPKRDREKWSHKATAAFRVSERELAELAGFSRPRIHRALESLLAAGFVVELAPAKPRGEGRGTAPATYALKCHMGSPAKPDPISSDSISSEAPDPRSPAQTWSL